LLRYLPNPVMVERSLATVLFTDIVGSTERAAQLGDEGWRNLLDRHHALVRRWLKRFAGREIKTAGDGFLVVFDSPARALACADAIRNAVRELGLEIRCGLHIGEIETKDGDVGGLAVHIGSRVAALAGRGEVFVSSTVCDAEAGSGFEFEDRGRHELKGVPGQWRIHALVRVPEEARVALLETAPAGATRRGFWSRVRSSRLIQALLIYAAVSWVVLQMTGMFIDRMGLPDWALPAAILLLVIGLVVIGATAWVQSSPRTVARAATGRLPRARAVDIGGIKDAIWGGEMPHLTWGRAIAGGVFAFALLFGLAGLYVVVKDRGRSFSPAEAVAESAAPGIAVLPFTVQGAGLDVWREGMVDLLSTNLDGAGGLRSIDSRTVLARWNERIPAGGRADLATALEVGRLAGAQYVLLGSVVSLGTEVRLSAEVYDAEDGEKLGQGQVIGAPDSVFSLVDRLSIEVLRAVLRGHEEELPGVNLARVTTNSLQALKAYLEGEVLFRRGDFDAAIPAYERAVEADSTFALANYRLSTSYGWAENIQSELAEGAIERAVRHAHRLPEREADLLRADLAMTLGTLDGIEPLERAVRRHPDDPEAWYLLGETYFHLGPQALIPPEKAEEAFARAVRLDPRFLPAYIHRIDYALMTADSVRAAALIDSVARFVHAGRTETVRPGRVIYDLAFGDAQAQAQAWEIMEERLSDNAVSMALQDFRHPRFRETEARLYELALRKNPGRPGARVNLALNRFHRGRIAEGLETLEEPGFPPGAQIAILYRVRRQGLPVPEERVERAATRELPEDLDAVGRAVHLFFRSAHAADRGREAERAAARGSLRDLAARLRVEGDSTNARFADGVGRALDGLLAWQRGDRRQAERFLEEARVQATGHGPKWVVNDQIRWWLGELLVEAGRHHDAERYFASLWFDPMADRRLGDLYLEMEELDKARESYERFLMAWRDADPAARPLVARTQQTVTSLAPLRRE
jgi:class 3 adenylate cyclase/tetratricopeptide (TPR) repeat protein